MPTTFGENFHHPQLHTPFDNTDTAILPIHTAQHRELQQRDRRRSTTAQGTELNIFPRPPDAHNVDSKRVSNPANEASPDLSDSDEGENDPLVQGEGSKPQMQRRGKGRKSKTPDLKIKTSNGHLNGHANGDMNHLEHRRKHGVGEDPASQKAALMSREDFSLDNEPPPQTPQTPAMVTTSFSELPAQDKKNFLLLCLLYFLQGIPMGLAAGSVPFLLKKYLSYGQIGVFSLAIYPYSLKLLWSPIVDAIWSKRFGRRKSWIVPIQAISGMSMIYLGYMIDDLMVKAGANEGSGVWSFTGWWFLLVFLCATQDIAVDGWAISLLSMQNIAYASTAQTVGLTAGSFLSHTVFLALSAPDFANRWFRKTPLDVGMMSLGGYMEFWGWAYIVVTAGLAILKKENKSTERDGIISVYKSMWGVMRLRNVLTLIAIHLIAKLGFVTNDAVSSLKLIDKGFGQSNMALVVLIDFPFEISLGYYAGKWSTKYTPLRLWCWAFVARLGAAVFAQVVVMVYPTAPTVAPPTWYVLLVIVEHVYSTFTNTVMFVATSAFHARIADPAIGGTYMTLLATVSNLGGTFPKFFILKFVDMFTSATCNPASDPTKLALANGITPITSAFSCVMEADRARCVAGGGTCVMNRDGYYITNVMFVLVGAITFWTFIERKALALQALPLRAWRLGSGSSGGDYTRVSTELR